MEEKIEVRMPAELKRAVEAAAVQDGDGNVGAWVRALIREKLRALDIPVAASKPAKGKAGR